jgi:hypothetical protein
MEISAVDDCSGAWKLLETVLALSMLSRSCSDLAYLSR